MKSRLIIDGQILQTSAFDRGMGKYTLSLVREFLKEQQRYQSIELLLNKNLNSTTDRLHSIEAFLGHNDIVLLDLPADISKGLHTKYNNAVEIISAYINKTSDLYSHTDFLVTSPFFVDFPAVFPSNDNVGKYVIIYDIIPQKIWHFLRIFPDDIYFNHFKLFFEADRLFTISGAVKDDLIKVVGVDDKKITNINGGPFEKKSTSRPKSLKLKNPFILYPSAPIVHKNNERAIKAFERFNQGQGNKYTLYLTSTFDESYQSKLQALSDNVMFTGNILDEELTYMYKKAELLFFPSLSEGLGMPVLEAVQYGVPVACSNIAVLTEISNRAFYQFDPMNEGDIARALTLAVQKKNWNIKQRAYKRVEKEFTWQKAAEKLSVGLGARLKKDTPKKSLLLDIPNPKTDTPAGVFGEVVYGILQEHFAVGVKSLHPAKPKRASFLEYVTPISKEADIKIKTADKKSLSRARKIKVTINNKDKKQHLILSAHRIFKDNAVQLKGWEFYARDGQVFTPAMLLDVLSSYK